MLFQVTAAEYFTDFMPKRVIIGLGTWILWVHVNHLNLKALINTISERNNLRRLVAVYIDNEVLFYAAYSVSCYQTLSSDAISRKNN